VESIGSSGVFEVVYQSGDGGGKQFDVGQPRLHNNNTTPRTFNTQVSNANAGETERDWHQTAAVDANMCAAKAKSHTILAVRKRRTDLDCK
jgi:hypothetical protein